MVGLEKDSVIGWRTQQAQVQVVRLEGGRALPMIARDRQQVRIGVQRNSFRCLTLRNEFTGRIPNYVACECQSSVEIDMETGWRWDIMP